MPKIKKSRRQLFRKHVHSKLLIQLRIFAAVALVMFGIVLYDVWEDIMSVELAALGIVVGLIAGFVVGKLYKVIWHEDSQKIVTRMDKFGIVVIALYIGFSIFRRQIFGQFIHGPALTAVTFASVGGVMVGRFTAIVGNINKILQQQKIF